MKKFLYFFGILALIAGLVSSCSKDDENENKPSIPQKRIAKLVKFPGDLDEESSTIYEYDDKGRCISSTYTYDGKVGKENYTYEGNTMTKTTYSYYGDTSITIYSYNSKGYLESIKREGEHDSYTCTYKYDNEGHLISETTITDSHTSTMTFEWENGDVIKIKENNKNSHYERTDSVMFKYTTQRHPTPVANAVKLSVLESTCYFDIDPTFSNMGISPKHLPMHVIETTAHVEVDIATDTYTFTDYTEEYDLEWVLDGDQYPITLNFKEENLDYIYFNAFWE
ncbi:MAG: hypothetical protein UH071_11160 [Paludibacteraceae bacterium]|nr:hypothetical protein [Paludibacteraceae bacterium]